MNNNEDFTSLYESAPVGLWRISLFSGEILYANKETLKILGFKSFEELSAKAFDFKEIARKCDGNLEINDLPVVLKRKDNKEITASVSAKVYYEKGFIEGSLRDVSGVISIEASQILPYIEKISCLKNDILEKIKQNPLFA